VVVKSSRKNKHGNECGVLDIYIEDIKVESEREVERQIVELVGYIIVV